MRSSFDLVGTREPNLTHVFYEELFTRHPEARSLFTRQRPEVQEQMLAEALTGALDHLEDAAWLESKLGALGTRHAEYGVTEPMYGWVADSLLVTLRRAAGADWTPELEAAWTEAIGAIASLMLAGYPQRTPL